MMGWQVRAKNENGESSPWGLTSNELIVGPAAKLPFVENFNVWTSEWNVSSDNLWIGARIDGGYLSWTVTEYVSCFFKENAEAEKIYGVDAADGAKDGVVGAGHRFLYIFQHREQGYGQHASDFLLLLLPERRV